VLKRGILPLNALEDARGSSKNLPLLQGRDLQTQNTLASKPSKYPTHKPRKHAIKTITTWIHRLKCDKIRISKTI
jgi:hypothetical protein